jgi:hypothetical protein
MYSHYKWNEVDRTLMNQRSDGYALSSQMAQEWSTESDRRTLRALASAVEHLLGEVKALRADAEIEQTEAFRFGETPPARSYKLKQAVEGIMAHLNLRLRTTEATPERVTTQSVLGLFAPQFAVSQSAQQYIGMQNGSSVEWAPDKASRLKRKKR